VQQVFGGVTGLWKRVRLKDILHSGFAKILGDAGIFHPNDCLVET